MEQPGRDTLRDTSEDTSRHTLSDAIERLSKAIDKSHAELDSLSRRDVALRARYRTSLTSMADRIVPDLTQRTLHRIRTHYQSFASAHVVDVFARNGVLRRVLRTRGYNASLTALREHFISYVGQSAANPFIALRDEIAAIEGMIVRERERQIDAAGVLAGLRCALSHDAHVPTDVATDLLHVSRPRAKSLRLSTVEGVLPNATDPVAKHAGGASGASLEVPQSVREFALSNVVCPS